MTTMEQGREGWQTGLMIGVVMFFLASGGQAWADTKAEKVFNAAITDAQSVETEVKNVVFYWEEKISETSFVPHELRHVPVKRGAATVSVKFDTIKHIDAEPAPDKGGAVFTITLTNGKSADFTLAIAGSFRDESDFGQVDFPANAITEVVFK